MNTYNGLYRLDGIISFSLALSHSPYMKLIFCSCLSTSKILFPYVHIYSLQSYITKI